MKVVLLNLYRYYYDNRSGNSLCEEIKKSFQTISPLTIKLICKPFTDFIGIVAILQIVF